MKKFSPKYGTFYPDDLLPEALPADVIDVSQDEYFKAVNRQPGETLVVTEGHLYIVAAP